MEKEVRDFLVNLMSYEDLRIVREQALYLFGILSAKDEAARLENKVRENFHKYELPGVGHMEVSDTLFKRICSLIKDNKKVAAIKEVREVFNIGLKESKDFVESGFFVLN